MESVFMSNLKNRPWEYGQLPNLLRLRPCVVEKIWGGKILSDRFKTHRVGESWELADLQEGRSYIENSVIDFSLANDQETKLAVWGPSRHCPYMIKYIDAAENLSIQVHPSDEEKNGQMIKGKSECWLVVGVEDARCQESGIYLGLRPGVSIDDFAAALRDEKWIASLLNFIPVKSGDFFVVPAGTVHAIGSGVMLLEVQQLSNVTYRAWDWNRENARPLNVSEALATINRNFKSDQNQCLQLMSKRNIWQLSTSINHHSDINHITYSGDINKLNLLYEHPEFRVSSVLLSNKSSARKQININSVKRGNTRPTTFLCLEGPAKISRGNETMDILPFETILAPFKGAEEVVISTEKESKIVVVE